MFQFGQRAVTITSRLQITCLRIVYGWRRRRPLITNMRTMIFNWASRARSTKQHTYSLASFTKSKINSKAQRTKIWRKWMITRRGEQARQRVYLVDKTTVCGINVRVNRSPLFFLVPCCWPAMRTALLSNDQITYYLEHWMHGEHVADIV